MTNAKKTPIGSLTVSRADGSSYTVPILGPGSVARFSVGAPNAHGLVWRLWSAPNTADLYLAVRTKGAGDSKWSFHASGDWRLQYEQSRAAELGVDRVLHRWRRPEPGPLGMIEVIRVVVPTDDIVENKVAVPEVSKVEWVPPAQPSRATLLHIFVVPTGSSMHPPSNADVVHAMTLSDGSLVLVLASASDIPADLLGIFKQARDTVIPPPGVPEDWMPRSDPEYRCVVNAVTANGDEHHIWDLLM